MYSLGDRGTSPSVNLREVWEEKLSQKVETVVPTKAWLTSERYCSDLMFATDATFFHILKNNHPTNALDVITQDYLIGSLKPYMHELTIRVRFFGDESMSAKFIGRQDYSVSLDYIRRDEGSSENLITISDLVVPP